MKKFFALAAMVIVASLFSVKSLAYVAPDCTGPAALTQEITYDLFCGDIGTGSGIEFCIDNFDSDDDGIVNCSDRCREIKGSEELDGCPMLQMYQPLLALTPWFSLDDDGDGVRNDTDNCPSAINEDQKDSDDDDIGDACDDDIDNDGFANADDACDLLSAPDSENGCPDGACPDEFDSCMAAGGDDDVVDSDGDGKTDDVDSCPDVAADTDDGCEASTTPIIGGGINDTTGTDDDPPDAGANAAEDFTSGSCSLVPSASNVLSALILAISLLPIGIRRKMK